MTATEVAQETGSWSGIPAKCDDCRSRLTSRTPWSQVQYEESLELYQHFMDCSDSYVNPGIKKALNTLDHAYRLYGPESVVCSFNGGKDAVVILHLVRASHAKYYNSTGGTPIRPRVIYFDHADEFPEVINFLKESVRQYDLDMVAFEKGVKFSDGLEVLVDNNYPTGCDHTFPMAFVLGTRDSDPNAVGQDHFAPSSHWMPPFMRVNPVLDWNYGNVWHFLRLFQLPYCTLYDQGYTSLGTTKDTVPCPALAVNIGDEATSSLPKFWPAYMLRDWEQERAGRIKKKVDSPTSSKKGVRHPIRRSVSALSIGGQLESRSTILDSSAEDLSEIAPEGLASENPVISGDDSSMFSLASDDCIQQKTVGLLIIGDEILKGWTADQNTCEAAKALRKEFVKLGRVVVVSDDQDEIVKEIERLQSEVDVIITSGGVGPTHDDVTIKGVAASLNREMAFNSEMADLLKVKMNNGTSELTPAQEKMAMLPTNAKLRYLSEVEDDWPVLQCRNVFVLPGVPEYFAKNIKNVAAYLSSQLERGAAFKVVLSVDETSIVPILDQAVADHPGVSFGSYPFVSHPEYKTVLTLEGKLVAEGDCDSLDTTDMSTSNLQSRNSTFFDQKELILPKEKRDRFVRNALDDLITKLPNSSILRVENDGVTPFA